MFTGKDTGLTRLVYPEVSDLDYPRYVYVFLLICQWRYDIHHIHYVQLIKQLQLYIVLVILLSCYLKLIRFLYSDCKDLSANDTWVAGSVVLCFPSTYHQGSVEDAAWSLRKTGIRGLIVAEPPSRSLYTCPDNIPCLQVSYEIGMKILNYIRSNR